LTPGDAFKSGLPVEALITQWPMGWTYRIAAALARLPNRAAAITSAMDLADISTPFTFVMMTG
jgi:hypothetical protein